MLGSMKTVEGDSYWLEDCDGLYVMKQFPQTNFPPDKAVISDLPVETVPRPKAGFENDNTTQVRS